VVLFTEKALVVGRIQIAFDPNLFPFTNKRSDNSRYKCLDTLLGHGSDAIDGADNAAFDDDVEVDLPDPSSVWALGTCTWLTRSVLERRLGTWHLAHSVSA
jgi:hypothetical protein